jgi:hypothetical protein
MLKNGNRRLGNIQWGLAAMILGLPLRSRFFLEWHNV